MSGKTVEFKNPGKGQGGSQAADDWVNKREVPTKNAERMKRFTIDVPESLHKRIKTQCAMQGVKMADEIRALLEKRFRASEKA